MLINNSLLKTPLFFHRSTISFSLWKNQNTAPAASPLFNSLFKFFNSNYLKMSAKYSNWIAPRKISFLAMEAKHKRASEASEKGLGSQVRNLKFRMWFYKAKEDVLTVYQKHRELNHLFDSSNTILNGLKSLDYTDCVQALTVHFEILQRLQLFRIHPFYDFSPVFFRISEEESRTFYRDSLDLKAFAQSAIREIEERIKAHFHGPHASQQDGLFYYSNFGTQSPFFGSAEECRESMKEHLKYELEQIRKKFAVA